MTAIQAIPVYEGLATLAGDYDGYVLDLWGVLHDGETAFPPALDCLARLRGRGARVAILSNAPRRAETVAARCAELGILPDHYDAIVSSGEDAWQHLKDRPDAFYRSFGNRAYHLGPPRDGDMLVGNGLEPVATMEEADFVLNTGAGTPEHRVDDFREVLEAALARGLKMVCANPDLTVVRGGRREICAGAIAQRYEEMGGQVRWHGKPNADIYERCRAALAGCRRVAAVGDSLRTDMAGAKAAGIDGIFVAGGIHADEFGGAEGPVDGEKLALAAARAGVEPVAALPELRW